jgi:ribonucleoside-diphosphate reductase alpha chain
MYKATSSLMTGGGIGVDYSALRESGALVKRTGGYSTGPISLMRMVNEAGRNIMQGGQRRSAIYASLNWKHKDVDKFLVLKNHSPELRAMKEKDFNFNLDMELTNISVNYDTEFFIAIDNKEHPLHARAWEVFLLNCKQAFSTAEPGFSFNFRKDTETLRNACCEVVSEDDSDKCNLGTLWINRIKDTKELRKVTKYATKFLICGGIYSDVPNEKIREVGNKNNRIGLGLGGIHEWLMAREMKYEVTPELHKWLAVYEEESDSEAFISSRTLNVSTPKGIRAVAPTGTIGIIAETTTGIEPLFCKAYKRRYFKEGKWLSQYVVDGSVKRLLSQGIKVENIQDSYDLDFKTRIKFQADVQNYVDMAISSTCNMPSWGSSNNNDSTIEKNAKILLKYAKRLRGFTVYPDGCRGGQPLTQAPLQEALDNEGTVYEETERECLNGVCGL